MIRATGEENAESNLETYYEVRKDLTEKMGNWTKTGESKRVEDIATGRDSISRILLSDFYYLHAFECIACM